MQRLEVSCVVRRIYTSLVAKGLKDTEISTVEPLAPEPSDFDTEEAIEKLKIYKSAGTDPDPAEMIHA